MQHQEVLSFVSDQVSWNSGLGNSDISYLFSLLEVFWNGILYLYPQVGNKRHN